MTISTMKNVTAPKPEPIGTADSETTGYFRTLWKDVAPEYAKELTGSMGLVAQRTAAAIARGAKSTRTASKGSAPKVTNVRPVTAVKTANGIAYEGFARVDGKQAIFSAVCEPSFSGPRVKLAALQLLKQVRTSQVADAPEDDGAEGESYESHNEGRDEASGEHSGSEIESIMEGFKAIKAVDPDMFTAFLAQAQKSPRMEIDAAFAAAVDRCLAECNMTDEEAHEPGVKYLESPED